MFESSPVELFSMPDNNLVHKNIDRVRNEVLSGISGSPDSWELLVVDLTNVYTVDVRGIQLITEFYKITRDQNKKFMLINVREELLRYLQLFRLHTKFPIGLNKTSAQLKAEGSQNAQ